jgi:hypothetical protein
LLKGSTRAEHQASGGEPSAFYVTGGQQRTFVETDEWRQYGKGVIVRVDLTRGAAQPCVEYESPPEVRPEQEASITFKAGTLCGDKLYVCTSTEVLVYDVPSFALAGYVSLPCFNDLHHVRPTPHGTLLVANTGLDMVVEVSEAGDKVREWNVLGGDPWTRFSSEVDYRKVPTTKPHHSHPNHVFMLDDEVWVTRFEQRDAVCLNGDLTRMPVDVQRPHDGTPHHGYVYFTTVDGHIVVVNQKTRKLEEVVDLNPQNGQEPLLGWCRGLKVVDPTKVWVGFSRFRPTKFVENVSWIKNGFRRRRKPTHIALYDLVRKERIQEIDVESAGLHTVFSIVDAPEYPAVAGSRGGRAQR